MRIVLLALAILLAALGANAQDLVPPEVVRLQNLKVDGEMRTVYMGNANKQWVLFCHVNAAGCISPYANRNYLLFDARTRWKMPGAKDLITLSFIQDWTVKYNEGENIGLVPENAEGDLGMFLLDRNGGGYERDTIFSDGPIIYGAGMSDKDRQNAWKRFFLIMVQAVTEQQGKDALGVKLARRCLPNQDVCTTTLDAMLVGVGGIQEPRRVLVIVASDVQDKNKLVARMVCTWPAKDKQVCRDWDTGKLVTGDMTKEHISANRRLTSCCSRRSPIRCRGRRESRSDLASLAAGDGEAGLAVARGGSPRSLGDVEEHAHGGSLSVVGEIAGQAPQRRAPVRDEAEKLAGDAVDVQALVRKP